MTVPYLRLAFFGLALFLSTAGARAWSAEPPARSDATDAPLPPGAVARLGILRALEVVETAGTPAAREVLDRLARGDDEVAAAKASLERLESRAAVRP
jgi:hypothetical protein